MTPEEDQLRYRLAVAEAFIGSRGYMRCTSPVCNCGSWHGGFAERRLDEIDDYITGCGMWKGTILDSIKFVFRSYGLDQEPG